MDHDDFEEEEYTDEEFEEFEAQDRQMVHDLVTGRLPCARCQGREEVFRRGWAWADVDDEIQVVCMSCLKALHEERWRKPSP